MRTPRFGLGRRRSSSPDLDDQEARHRSALALAVGHEAVDDVRRYTTTIDLPEGWSADAGRHLARQYLVVLKGRVALVTPEGTTHVLPIGSVIADDAGTPGTRLQALEPSWVAVSHPGEFESIRVHAPDLRTVEALAAGQPPADEARHSAPSEWADNSVDERANEHAQELATTRSS